MFCSKPHDCMFGAGKFCNRRCAMSNTAKGKKDKATKKLESEEKGKLCKNKKCIHAGELQPIENFYKRSRGEEGYRIWCKKCDAVEIRKHQTTRLGFVKTSLNSARRRAQMRDLEFELTLEYLEDLLNKQQGNCALTGRQMTHCSNPEGSRNPFNMSIDRIDSSGGYTKGNVQWICTWIQGAKSDWKETEFKHWIVEAAKHIVNSGRPE